MNAPHPPPARPLTVADRHLRLALEQVSDGVLIVEAAEPAAPRIAFANAAIGRLYGRPAESLVGTPCAQLVPEDHRPALAAAMARAATGEPAPFTTSAPGDGDRLLFWHLTATRGGSGEPDGLIATIRCPAADASDPAMMPADGFPAVQPDPAVWQGDLLDTIRETARYVAHEFNNSLTAIVLPVELAMQEVAAGGELHSQLQVAMDSSRRAAALARDFLDCFRPKPPARELLRPAGLLTRALRLAACGQDLDNSLDLDPALPAIRADSGQMERVIFNLMRNASQAMPEGGRVRLSARGETVAAGEIEGLPAGDYLCIRFRDWGPGIEEENLKHLFHSRFTTKRDGNGCGLPVCYQIVRAHGGEMLVRSRIHVGTEFIIYLPAEPGGIAFPVPAAAPADDPPLPVPTGVPAVSGSAPREVAGFGSSLPSLLVVDDEDAVRQALGKIAVRMGFEVETVGGSEEALHRYCDRLRAGRPFHSVLLDIHLRGGMTGAELMQVIRRMDPDAFVVATSGQHSAGDIERYRRLGFAGFLPKPYTISEFDRVMRTTPAM